MLHHLSQMAIEVEPARALVWYAAEAIDKDLDDASRATAIANAHLSDRNTGNTRRLQRHMAGLVVLGNSMSAPRFAGLYSMAPI